MSTAQSKNSGAVHEIVRAPASAPPASTPAEAPGAHLRRRVRRVRLNLVAFVTVALLVCLVALTIANTRQVKLSWVFGSTTASLVWIILAAAVLGWLLGVTTAVSVRRRTRRQPTR